MSIEEPQASEKAFYLRSFRHRSMLFHLAEPYAERDVREVVDELVDNGTLVIVVARRLVESTRGLVVRAVELEVPAEGLCATSSALMSEGCARIRQPARRPAAALRFSCRLACRLGVHKLVIVDPRGGVSSASGLRSFLNAASLLRLARPRKQTSAWTRAELAVLRATVMAGVDTINLTAAGTLAEELFSYEGAGTLVTASEYCRVEPLRLDDFSQALGLIDRGEREGFLLRRTATERARLLLSAYGAWFEGHRLAGIAALETDAYKRERLAEIVGLYTITRFKGEGVGVRILDALREVASERGCRALFACTSNPRAAEFFERNRFARAEASSLPERKWKKRRKPWPDVFWRDL